MPVIAATLVRFKARSRGEPAGGSVVISTCGPGVCPDALPLRRHGLRVHQVGRFRWSPVGVRAAAGEAMALGPGGAPRRSAPASERTGHPPVPAASVPGGARDRRASRLHRRFRSAAARRMGDGMSWRVAAGPWDGAGVLRGETGAPGSGPGPSGVMDSLCRPPSRPARLRPPRSQDLPAAPGRPAWCGLIQGRLARFQGRRGVISSRKAAGLFLTHPASVVSLPLWLADGDAASAGRQLLRSRRGASGHPLSIGCSMSR